MLDPDPHKTDADPKHWLEILYFDQYYLLVPVPYLKSNVAEPEANEAAIFF
jgi:hypothetical protein